MSSRLFQEVREKRGLAYSVYSFAASYADAGLVGLYAGCSPKRAGTVAELMLSEFRRLAADGITDDELARAQGQLGGASALALEDSDTRMTRLGRSELTFGEFSDLDEILRRIAGVTATDVAALAAELVERPLSVAAVGAIPAGAFDGLRLDRPDGRGRLMSRYLYLVRHGEQQDAEHGLPDGPLSPRGVRQAQALAERLGGVPVHRRVDLPAAARAGDGAHHDREDAGPRAAAVRAADGLHPVGSRARHAARLRVVLRRGHPRRDRGGRGADGGCRGRVDDPVARRSSRPADHAQLRRSGWFVREVFGAPNWRWLGLNQANCGLTIIRVRSAKPPVLVDAQRPRAPAARAALGPARSISRTER